MITVPWDKTDPNEPYFIAEVSCNHGGRLDIALDLIRKAADAGADCVKFQCYEPRNLTLDVDKPPFRIIDGPWGGQSLWELYARARTPYEWIPDLMFECRSAGVDFLCTAYDAESFDYLQSCGVSMVKVSSFDMNDTVLMRRIADSGIPAIISTGMAFRFEVERTAQIFCEHGTPFALLLCKSKYPAVIADFPFRDLRVLSRLSMTVGISDHTLNNDTALLGYALGARIFEKHIRHPHAGDTDDAFFSLWPQDFHDLVSTIKMAQAAISRSDLDGPRDKTYTQYRKSIWVSRDIEPGTVLDDTNIRVCRPEGGLPPSAYVHVIGKTVNRSMAKGDLVTMDCLNGEGTL